MKTVATIKIKIPFQKVLLDTMGEYSKAISYMADIGFKDNVINRYKLHHLAYYGARAKFKLPSQFVINANRIASQALKSIKTSKSNSKPIFKSHMPLDFDKRTFTFKTDKVRLATINGRIDIPIDIPEYYWKYLDWPCQTIRLAIDKKNRMFLNITFSRDINAINSCNRFHGVDVGINHVAVTSNKQFFSGTKIKIKRLKFKRLRARLQSKGTRSAQKLLKKISGRERRFKAYWNHVISKQIVSGCEAGDTIVLENLKGIRNIRKGRRFNFWLNGWSFYQLHSFIKYKAIQRGIKVIKVSPYRTSKLCSHCGELGSRFKGFFVCSHCNYSLNADLNASYNLAKHNSMPDCVSADVKQPHIQSDEHKGSPGAIACELMDNQHPKA